MACSAKKDNLLGNTYIFSILGVSFCVTRNAFNFIEIKNKNIGHSSESLLFLYVVLFYIYGVVASVRVAQNVS